MVDPPKGFPELTIDYTDGGSFKNRILVFQEGASHLILDDTGKSTDFAKMARLRGNRRNQEVPMDVLLESFKEGRELSNVGVSSAITVTIGQDRYALVGYRTWEKRHMLLSGYVDADKYTGEYATTLRGEFVSNSLREIKEEFLAANTGGELQLGVLSDSIQKEELLSELRLRNAKNQCSLCGLPLGKPYVNDNLYYHPSEVWTLKRVEPPAFLPSLHPCRRIVIDGKVLTAGFYFDQPNNSGQIVFGFELELKFLEGLYALHAEDGLAPGSRSHLRTVVRPNGIVFLKLDKRGIPNGETYWLRDGRLKKCTRVSSPIQLSEAFAPCVELSGLPTGIVRHKGILFNDYRDFQNHRKY